MGFTPEDWIAACVSRLAGRTPDEVWSGKNPPPATPVRASDPDHPAFDVVRRRYRSDPRLPTIDIRITRRLKRSA